MRCGFWFWGSYNIYTFFRSVFFCLFVCYVLFAFTFHVCHLNLRYLFCIIFAAAFLLLFASSFANRISIFIPRKKHIKKCYVSYTDTSILRCLAIFASDKWINFFPILISFIHQKLKCDRK